MINIMSDGNGLVIENCKFVNGGNYVGSPKPNKHQYDFSFIYSEWDGTIVRNNVIKQEDINIGLGNYTGGVEIHGDFSSVTGNFFKGCWPAIYITSSGIDTMKYITIENNRLINCVTGISFWLVKPMKDIIIRHNEIRLAASRSPKLEVSAGIIIPNANAKEYTKKLANAAPVINLQITENIISADTMQNLSAGIIVHSVQQSNIANNTISGVNYGGIVMGGSKWGSDSVTIKDNTFKDFRPNNSTNTVAAYILMTDTYSPNIPDAPGFQDIVIVKNSFFNNARKFEKAGKGKFFGIFIALPSKMLHNIRFTNNEFSAPSEGIKIIKTD